MSDLEIIEAVHNIRAALAAGDLAEADRIAAEVEDGFNTQAEQAFAGIGENL